MAVFLSPVFLVGGCLALALLVGVVLLIANQNTRLPTVVALGCLSLLPIAGLFLFMQTVDAPVQVADPSVSHSAAVSDAAADSHEGTFSHDAPVSHDARLLSESGVPLSPAQNLRYAVDTHFGWSALVLSALVLLVLVGAVGRLFNRQRPVAGMMLTGAMVVTVLLCLMRMHSQRQNAVQDRPRSIAFAAPPSVDAAFDQLTKPRIQLDTEASEATAEFADDSEFKQLTEIDVAESLRGPAANARVPNWVSRRVTRKGTPYQVVLQSGTYELFADCQADLRHQLLKVALEYLRYNSGHRVHRSGEVSIVKASDLGVGYDELYNRIVKGAFRYGGPSTRIGGELLPGGNTTFLRVEIDQPTGDWLIDRWASRGRWASYHGLNEPLEIVVVLSCCVLGLIAAAYGLLRIDSATNQRYSKRLFIGVPVGIIGMLLVLALTARLWG